MTDFFVKSGAGAIVYANRAWTLGQKMVPVFTDATTNNAVAKKWVWETTTAGTSNATPTWPAAVTQDVTTITQNTATWTARKPGYSSGATVDWAFSTIYFAYGVNATAAGDRVLVSGFHSESPAGVTMAINSPGTFATPVTAYTVTDTITSGWSGVSSPSTVNASTGGTITFNGFLYCAGINFISATNFTFNSSGNQTKQVFDSCSFTISGSGASALNLGNGTPVTELVWNNCSVKFGATTQRLTGLKVNFRWIGGSWTSGGSTPTSIFQCQSTANDTLLEMHGVDLSALGTGFNFIQSASTTSLKFLAVRCKMPSSWAGALFGATPTSIVGLRGEMHNCVNAISELPQKWIEDAFGTLKATSAITRSTGDTSESWYLVATTNTVPPGFGFYTPWAVIQNTSTGSSKNLAVYTITDAATAPTNADLALEMQYRGTSNSPLPTFAGDYPANALAASAAQTADTSAWTAGTVAARANSTAYIVGNAIKLASNTGRVFFCTGAGTSSGSEPVGYASAVDGDAVADGTATFRAGWRQKLDVTFTPQETGFIMYRVMLTRQSVTTYLDRQPVIT